MNVSDKNETLLSEGSPKKMNISESSVWLKKQTIYAIY